LTQRQGNHRVDSRPDNAIQTMNRRQILIKSAQLGLGIAARRALGDTPRSAAHGPRALPSPDQVAWQDLEMGMFVHFAPNTWQDVESDNLTTPLSVIDPKKLDTDQWARTAVSLGAKYIVFVAKHQGGFCMWQTQTTEYSIRNTPWRDGKGDVLADVAASCRKFGLKLGVYVCPRDDHFGAKTGGVCAKPELQKSYDAMYREQLTEVLSRYGEMVEVWFDGSIATPVTDILLNYQPHAMVFQGPSATIRWVGNEDGFAPNPCWNGISRADARSGTATSLNSDPDGDAWMPNEVDVSIRRPDWFWSTTNEKKVLSVYQLLTIYYCSVGRGCQLLLNIPAGRDGLLPQPDCDAAIAFGQQIRQRFAAPIATTSGSGAVVSMQLREPTRIDTVVLQETIGLGERVRAYRIEGRSSGVWRALAAGTSIGHKRIQPVEPTTVDALQLVATLHVGVPAIRSLAAYDTGVAPPSGWDARPQIWSADLVGTWSDGRFAIDLTSKIDAVKQYRLRFVPSSGRVAAVLDVVLTLHDVPEPKLIKTVPGKSDEFILDITGVAETVRISGRVAGAASGQILLQKI